MNKRIVIIGTLIVVLSLLVGLSGSVGANGPTLEEQIEASIQAGLTWLAGQQQVD